MKILQIESRAILPDGRYIGQTRTYPQGTDYTELDRIKNQMKKAFNLWVVYEVRGIPIPT